MADDVKKIEFSREASTQIDGIWYHSFQMYSYIARVEYFDGTVILEALPSGAASSPTNDYVAEVLERADKAKANGADEFVVWEN